jgi:hypothetical protein
VSPASERGRFGLSWHCPACGRKGRVFDVLCANCWQPRPLLPLPAANVLAFLDHPFFLNVVVPQAETAMAGAAKRAPVVVDTLEAVLRQLQPLVMQLWDRLPNVAEVSAPQARQAAEQLRWMTEVALPWLETAFTHLQTDLFKGLPDWSARTEGQLQLLNRAFQALLDRLDQLIDVLDRQAPGWWQPDGGHQVVRDLLRLLRP